jgi:hypothetical protein
MIISNETKHHTQLLYIEAAILSAMGLFIENNNLK